jgi:hypothetical protein
MRKPSLTMKLLVLTDLLAAFHHLLEQIFSGAETHVQGSHNVRWNEDFGKRTVLHEANERKRPPEGAVRWALVEPSANGQGA